eukprot:13103552-Heterocapsa_arctica.AAC.1
MEDKYGESNKDKRKIGGDVAISGMRNPSDTFDQAPGWRRVGQQLREILRTLQEDVPELNKVGERFGDLTYENSSAAA